MGDRKSWWRFRVGCMAVAAALWCGAAAGAQSSPSPGSAPPRPGQSSSLPQLGDASSGTILESQAAARNLDRQRRLVADTQRLLQLATELKSEVDKTNQNILSVDVVKKAEEIERLAKSVKERMKG